MKTKIFYCTLVSMALSAGMAVADDTKPTEKKNLGERTVESLGKAGKVVAEDTKKAGSAIKDAVMPESNARKIDVTLREKRIEMARQIPSGKTAFVVRNEGKERQNFKIEGTGLDKEFMIAVAPNDSKTMNVDLKPGEYKVFVPMPGKDSVPKGSELSLTVK